MLLLLLLLEREREREREHVWGGGAADFVPTAAEPALCAGAAPVHRLAPGLWEEGEVREGDGPPGELASARLGRPAGRIESNMYSNRRPAGWARLAAAAGPAGEGCPRARAVPQRPVAIADTTGQRMWGQMWGREPG